MPDQPTSMSDMLSRLLMGQASGPEGSYGIANLARGGAIVGGLGGAAAAGVVGARDGRRAGESKTERAKRLIHNMLAGGVLGSGAGAALGGAAGMVPQVNKERSLSQEVFQTVPGAALSGAVGYTVGNAYSNGKTLDQVVGRHLAELKPEINKFYDKLNIGEAGAIMEGAVPKVTVAAKVGASDRIRKYLSVLAKDFNLDRHADFQKYKGGKDYPGTSQINEMLEDVARRRNLSQVGIDATKGRSFGSRYAMPTSAHGMALRPTKVGVGAGVGSAILAPLVMPYAGSWLKEKLLGQ